MRRFKHVIVRRPCRAMTEGITSGIYPGKPDYELALRQHDAYIEALKKCGVDVTVLPADENFPDSCFVEDPAVLTDNKAERATITDQIAPLRQRIKRLKRIQKDTPRLLRLLRFELQSEYEIKHPVQEQLQEAQGCG